MKHSTGCYTVHMDEVIDFIKYRFRNHKGWFCTTTHDDGYPVLVKIPE